MLSVPVVVSVRTLGALIKDGFCQFVTKVTSKPIETKPAHRKLDLNDRRPVIIKTTLPNIY